MPASCPCVTCAQDREIKRLRSEIDLLRARILSLGGELEKDNSIRPDIHLMRLAHRCAEIKGLATREISSKARRGGYLEARALFVLIGRDALWASYTDMGRVLKRDHGTIINSYKVGKTKYRTEPRFRRLVSAVCTILGIKFPGDEAEGEAA